VEISVLGDFEIVVVQVVGDARLESSRSDRTDKSVCYIGGEALTVKLRRKR
jgi:hypothetical protein